MWEEWTLFARLSIKTERRKVRYVSHYDLCIALRDRYVSHYDHTDRYVSHYDPTDRYVSHYDPTYRYVSHYDPTYRYVSHYDATDGTADVFVGMVKTADTATENKMTQKLRFDNCTISFKLYTGSDVSIISEQQYQCIKPAPKLEKSSTVMTSYSGTPIPSLGVCRVSVRYKKRQTSTYLEVVREECRPAILGGPDCDKLGLVKRVNAMKKDEAKSNDTMRAEIKKSYPQLFQAIGTLPGIHTIDLKDGATGVIHAPRRVAV